MAARLDCKGKKVKEAGQSIDFNFEKSWEEKLGKHDYQQIRLLLKKSCE